MAGNPMHDLSRREALHQASLHVVHIGSDVRPKLVVAPTEIVMPWLTCMAMCEAVLGALSPTCKEKFAVLTLLGETLFLRLPKGDLLGEIHQLSYGRLGDISEAIARIDEVVTTIEIPVMLECGSVPTLGEEEADTRRDSHPRGKGGIEELYEDFAHIRAYPFVEDRGDEVPPLLGQDAIGSHGDLPVIVQETFLGKLGDEWRFNESVPLSPRA